MIRTNIKWFCLFLVIGLSIMSCKGTPEEVETPAPVEVVPPVEPAQDPNAGPADQATIDAFNAAVKRAENSRADAFDVEGPAYFPSEWDAAESRYILAGQHGELKTLGEYKAATADYNAVADSFDALAQKCLPLYAEERRKEVLDARAAAIEAGIMNLAPDYLIMADNTADDALDQYEAGNYRPAAASAFLAADMYNALKTGADAYGIRSEIVERDFVRFDPYSFNTADDAGLSAIGAYEDGNIRAAQAQASDTLAKYGQFLSAGWQAYATERGTFAGNARTSALNLKANVAVRNEFNTAQGVYTNAESQFKARRYEQAVELYDQAESMFVSVAEIAQEKRRLAEEAIRAAEEKVASSDEQARDAENRIGGAR